MTNVIMKSASRREQKNDHREETSEGIWANLQRTVRKKNLPKKIEEDA